MPIIQWIFQNFLLPGLIGAALGVWLLGSGVRNGQNILGQTPLHWLSAAAIGGVLIGFSFWFIFGCVLGSFFSMGSF